MSQYFFALSDGEKLCDGRGTTFVDDAAARRFVVSIARDIMSDGVKRGCLELDHRIEVFDEWGAARFSVRFAEALEVRGGASPIVPTL